MHPVSSLDNVRLQKNILLRHELVKRGDTFCSLESKIEVGLTNPYYFCIFVVLSNFIKHSLAIESIDDNWDLFTEGLSKACIILLWDWRTGLHDGSRSGVLFCVETLDEWQINIAAHFDLWMDASASTAAVTLTLDRASVQCARLEFLMIAGHGCT